MMICKNCGTEFDDNMNKCPNCGAAVLIDNEQDDLSLDIDDIEIVNPIDEPSTSAQEKDLQFPDPDDIQIPETAVEEPKEEKVDNVVVMPNNVTTNDVAVKSKKKNPIFIVAIIAVAIIVAAAIFIASRPKLESISAVYNGNYNYGTVINNNSDFTVTAIYDNDEKKQVDDYSVDETTLGAGSNTITVKYKDKQTSVYIYGNMMENNEFTATCEGIRNEFEAFARDKLDGYTGLTLDGTSYALGYTTSDINLSFSVKDGDSFKEVDGNNIPDVLRISGTVEDADEYNLYVDDFEKAAAVALYTIDNTKTYDECLEFVQSASKEVRGSEAEKIETLYMLSDEFKFNNGVLKHSIVIGSGAIMYIFAFFSGNAA